MLDFIRKQQFGRIKRQMLEQDLARPLGDDIIKVEGLPQPTRNFMAGLMNDMHNKIEHRITREMLETNPMIQFKSYKDEIKINPIHPDRVYIGTDYGAYNGDYTADHTGNTELELTLVNGVYE